MSKETPWIPPQEFVSELIDAASSGLPEDAIYPVDVVMPRAEPLRQLVNGELAFDGIKPEQIFACLKDALVQTKASLESSKYLRETYQREERRIEERLEVLKAVAFELVEAYGKDNRIRTPIGDLRLQKNSQPSIWVDESKIDEIPESLGEYQLVKIEKRPSKTGIAAYLADLEEHGENKPDWAEIRPPGYHLRF